MTPSHACLPEGFLEEAEEELRGWGSAVGGVVGGALSPRCRGPALSCLTALVPQGYLGPLLLEAIFLPSVGCVVFPPAFYTQLAL